MDTYTHKVILFATAPTGAPHNVLSSTTSRSIHVSWDPIECRERNGEITGYVVEWMELGGTVMLSNVTGRNFASTGLTPFTRYTFRVAGVNINGTGPFSSVLTTSTDEDSMHMSYVAS